MRRCGFRAPLWLPADGVGGLEMSVHPDHLGLRGIYTVEQAAGGAYRRRRGGRGSRPRPADRPSKADVWAAGESQSGREATRTSPTLGADDSST